MGKEVGGGGEGWVEEKGRTCPSSRCICNVHDVNSHRISTAVSALQSIEFRCIAETHLKFKKRRSR